MWILLRTSWTPPESPMSYWGCLAYRGPQLAHRHLNVLPPCDSPTNSEWKPFQTVSERVPKATHWLCRIGRKHTNVSIQHYLGKTNGKLSPLSLLLQDEQKAKKIKNPTPSLIENNKCGTGVSIPKKKALEILTIPNSNDRTHYFPKASQQRMEKVDLSSNAKMTTQNFKEHKNQGNLTPPQKHSNFPVTNPKEKENYTFPRKHSK